MTAARNRLPNRRGNLSLSIDALNLPFIATFAWFDDGRLGEIFLTNHRVNSAAGVMASDAAIAASLALQFGCPPDVLRKALSRDAHGRPVSPLAVALDRIAAEGAP